MKILPHTHRAIRVVSVCFLAVLALSHTATAQTTDTPELPAHFVAGLEAYNANQLELAYSEFLISAEEGHLESQFNVALMYENGIGVEKDEVQALAWYLKSAQQGNAAAQYNLAVLYENGRGTEVDFAQANEWYRSASLQGDPLAIGNLGMLYLRGDGVPVDKVAGIALLLRSVTLDPSSENHARQNITGAQGLTPQIIQEAQVLADKMSKASSLLIPLDQHLTLANLPQKLGN
jgi:TPR repeat protein